MSTLMFQVALQERTLVQIAATRIPVSSHSKELPRYFSRATDSCENSQSGKHLLKFEVDDMRSALGRGSVEVGTSQISYPVL
ncbi:hypothetical protein R1sor_024855 [Riccia sorocarpa]|uniref:Uncharacterized protein n=1 Tax=Riccia sorocarpa TaxID=122646 RepID=A0ABD3GU42_9MARC